MTEKERLITEYICLWKSTKELTSALIKLDKCQEEVFEKLMEMDLSLEENLALVNEISGQALGDLAKALEKRKERK